VYDHFRYRFFRKRAEQRHGLRQAEGLDLRDRDDLKVKAIAGRAMAALASMRTAMVFAFPPPAVSELGMAKGFDFQLLDRGGLGHEALMAAQYQLLG